MRFRSILILVIVSLTSVFASQAHACVNGLEMAAGDSCEIDIKWGYDHWVVGDFTEGESTMTFEHLKGDCNVSLFGPTNGLLSPDLPPIRQVTKPPPADRRLFL